MRSQLEWLRQNIQEQFVARPLEAPELLVGPTLGIVALVVFVDRGREYRWRRCSVEAFSPDRRMARAKQAVTQHERILMRIVSCSCLSSLPSFHRSFKRRNQQSSRSRHVSSPRYQAFVPGSATDRSAKLYGLRYRNVIHDGDHEFALGPKHANRSDPGYEHCGRRQRFLSDGSER
jgi:hypothetical protein